MPSSPEDLALGSSVMLKLLVHISYVEGAFVVLNALEQLAEVALAKAATTSRLLCAHHNTSRRLLHLHPTNQKTRSNIHAPI